MWLVRGIPFTLPEGQPCSCAAAKQRLDPFAAHAIEIVRHRELSGHEPDTTGSAGCRSLHCDDFYYRLAGSGDDKRLTLCCFIDEARDMCLSLSNINDENKVSYD